jgi:CDP-glucose 4,6-dehydratase
LEIMVLKGDFWVGKRVFITGHTGFKGGWLSLWLHQLGAELYGYALPPPTNPALFEIAAIERLFARHTTGDVRDAPALTKAMQEAVPDVVLHLAAQPLVRYSYDAPAETFAVNVMGTVNVLEAARYIGSVRALVNVTTDKCYQNREWHWGYREAEPLGGHDPYSASKACSEIVTTAYRDSFAQKGEPWIGSGRAGNVIGGGDWALDRLLPDVFRAIDEEKIVAIRNSGSIRPWQHVLEPVAGYLALAEHLVTHGGEFASAWNFGPADSDARPVRWILDRIGEMRPGFVWSTDEADAVHEANYLKLDSSRARALLGWSPRWSLETALRMTYGWHEAWRAGQDMQAFSRQQIAEYQATPAQ